MNLRYIDVTVNQEGTRYLVLKTFKETDRIIKFLGFDTAGDIALVTAEKVFMNGSLRYMASKKVLMPFNNLPSQDDE